MATTTPAQLFPVPQTGDDPDVAVDMTNLAKAIEKRVVGVYTTTADRDTKTGAAGPEEGMMAFTKDTDTLWYRTPTTWVKYPPKIGSGPTVPTNSDPLYSDGDVFFKT